MSKPMIRIHNLETNEIIDREMNAEELAQYEIDKANAEAKTQTEAEAVQAKTALLNRLGLTQEEFNILIA